MASTADQLAALAGDSNFRARVQALATQIAATIYNEDPGVQFHAERKIFARNILAGGFSNIANFIVNRPNLIAGNTTYDFTDGHVKTDISDAAISSQINTDWNMLAGI